MRDYLVRSFELLKLEAAAEIREEVFDAAASGRLPWGRRRPAVLGVGEDGRPDRKFRGQRVDPPALGEDRPRRVLGGGIDLGEFSQGRCPVGVGLRQAP